MPDRLKMQPKGIYYVEIKINEVPYNRCVSTESIDKKINNLIGKLKNPNISVKILQEMGFSQS